MVGVAYWPLWTGSIVTTTNPLARGERVKSWCRIGALVPAEHDEQRRKVASAVRQIIRPVEIKVAT